MPTKKFIPSIFFAFAISMMLDSCALPVAERMNVDRQIKLSPGHSMMNQGTLISLPSHGGSRPRPAVTTLI